MRFFVTQSKKDKLLRFACAAEAITAMPVATLGCYAGVQGLVMSSNAFVLNDALGTAGNLGLMFISFMAVSFIVGPLQDGINNLRRINEAKRPNAKRISWYHALTPKNLLPG
jgi:hypothetical protein